ncbi:MAG TPA: 50S ribosomal protein L25 [Planctomycetota bacterium]|nr:50S ribosomal protein L25 [Planctomycetota bacterium]
MQITPLKTEPRSRLGSAESRRTRNQGRLPAVVYGLEGAPHACSVDARAFEEHLHAGHRAFQLDVDGKAQSALLQDVQYDALGEHIVHLDFKRIDLNRKIRVKVPLTFVGQPEASSGAVVDHVSEDIEVECLPAEIPAHVEVPIAALTVGHHIEAKDVALPKNVVLVGDPHRTLVSYHFKSVEQAAAATEVAATPAQPEMTKEKKDAAPAADAKGGDKKDKK